MRREAAALGGTCLNIGCIPSKALLQSSHLYEEAAHAFAKHGIKADAVDFDLAAMLARKDQVVKQLTQGVAGLFKKNKVDHVLGHGVIASAEKSAVTPQDGAEPRLLRTDNIVIATGSDVARLPGIDIDERRIVSSTGALSLETVPERMVVIGGGYIGIELGSVWRRLGAKVTVVEFLDQILAGMDGEVSKAMLRILQKQGLAFKLGSSVTKAEPRDGGVRLTVEPVNGGDAETIETEVVLVSVGRRPFTEGLGLENVGITLDNHGFIPVDHDFQTSVPGIFAIGDVIGGKMLAHKAEEEGVAVTELIAGQTGHVNYEAIPGVVYTWPEVAASAAPRSSSRPMALSIGRVSSRSPPTPRALQRGHRRLRQAPGRREDRPHSRRPHHRPRGRRPHSGDRRGDGVRRLGRGSRPLQPWPPRTVGSTEGSGAAWPAEPFICSGARLPRT